MNLYASKMERLIHLDLKTCPLKVNYLKELFPVIRDWGATGLLIEWEDTFPYVDELVDIGSVKNGFAYSASEVEEILHFAKLHNLSVIPLVQTFGHLEFVLKTEKWCHLRELPRYCSSMCPLHPESAPLVTSMIKQIMKHHPNSQFLHVGGDEVWHLGLCVNCRHQNKNSLFLKHMSSVLQFIRESYPHVTPIMWDDMLRNIDASTLKDFNLGEFVEPMIWEYRPVESFSLSSDLWEKYSQIFKNIWIASAFKGAVGSCQIYPIIGHYLSNHEKWLTIIEENRHRFESIRGIALTGWSRYDHYATLCELMPSGLISLALCLKTWLHGKYSEEIFQQTSRMLGFDEITPISLYPINRPVMTSKKLNFPGYLVHISIEWFENVRAKFNVIAYSDQAVTWLNKWHVKRNNTSKMQVEHIIINFNNLLNELMAVEQQLRTSLTEAYYNNTIEEWLGCYLLPLKEKLVELITEAESQLTHN